MLSGQTKTLRVAIFKHFVLFVYRHNTINRIGTAASDFRRKKCVCVCLCRNQLIIVIIWFTVSGITVPLGMCF